MIRAYIRIQRTPDDVSSSEIHEIEESIKELSCFLVQCDCASFNALWRDQKVQSIHQIKEVLCTMEDAFVMKTEGRCKSVDKISLKVD